MNVRFEVYKPSVLLPVLRIGELIIHSHLWDYKGRQIIADFRKAADKDHTQKAIADWCKWYDQTAPSNPDLESYVAVNDCSDAVGFIVAHKIENDEDVIGEVSSLAVRHDYWGRGIGQRLLSSAEEFLKVQHCRHAVLNVEKENFYAQNLYKKNGWSQIYDAHFTNQVFGNNVLFLEFEKTLAP